MPRKGFIDTEEDLRVHLRALRRACPHMRRIHAVAGDPPLRRHAPGLEGLARIVVGQQLSITSAAAIWTRTRATVEPFTAARLLATNEELLKTAGLSAAKIRTLKALASTIARGSLDIEAVSVAPEAEVHEALTAVTGIGPWTADIFLLFCAGRADAWAAGDLALQVAVQRLFHLDQRPRSQAMVDIAERWRPHRGAAARLLWAYYAVEKVQRSGAPAQRGRARAL